MSDIRPRWHPTIASAVQDACIEEAARQMAFEEKATDRALKAHHRAERQKLEAAAEELDILINGANTGDAA